MSTGQASNDHSESEIWWNYVELVGWSSSPAIIVHQKSGTSTNELFDKIYLQVLFLQLLKSSLQYLLPVPVSSLCLSWCSNKNPISRVLFFLPSSGLMVGLRASNISNGEELLCVKVMN